ncbi:MAG: cadmium-translocating P-type ATPase [Bacteroidetes bacterium]|nr:cadmium-translocating P-type ATPase [Bacteroidota bacterium]MBS1973530.1 cadmium-translocating P-type ATPase [Bacteroidota bacterium]
MESVNWKVDGMSCANCALTVGNYLKKEGMQNVKVNLIDGDVSFDMKEGAAKSSIIKGIQSLGYGVKTGNATDEARQSRFLSTHLQKFFFCLIFTLPLMLHMFHKWIPVHWLMDSRAQLGLCLPVYAVGLNYFGRSAINSIRNGMPNMNVLIILGATAAFGYSLAGTVLHLGADYMFYETTAVIITLIFLGNHIEDITVRSTQKALRNLSKSQKVMANMIAYDDEHHEQVFPVENTQLKSGDLILIKSGEQVPADCKILWGEASANESIITGESLPVEKKPKDNLIGGSILVSGTIKAQVTAAMKDSVLSNIIGLVKQAQGEKPPVQQMADKISAIFVPVVLVITVITFLVNYFFLQQLTPAIMRSIAVLVIACPCAMGLATPAAIAVGLGRAAKNGILFRNAKSLELFKNIRQVVFDKTGTLTTGKFTVNHWQLMDGNLNEEEFKRIIFSIEKYSNHPIAKSIAAAWKTKNEIRWKKAEEMKGLGMKAEDKDGNIYRAGSHHIAPGIIADNSHNVYLLKNNELLGWVDVSDEIRPGAKTVIDYFRGRSIKTILLSGDKKEKCEALANQLGIDETFSEQTPAQKLNKVEMLSSVAPTAMIGDGINDAPALAKATIGISMSDASHIAMQTADVVLMNNGIKNFPLALGLGKHTFITIRENLFWAFFYNVIAIPVAAAGLLSPAIAALAMGFSDVVLAGNSLRLFVKKVV